MERGRQSRAVSGRPSDLPMRVQDTNRMSMVYTTPKNKQPSFGKLNMPKPQSGTSERRTSFFDAARTSGASMPRNSIMSGFGGSEKIKDSRPLHDKAFVQQCTRQLHEFLTEHSYPGPLSAKTLVSPSTKEFVKVFEFVYCQIDPMFEMPNSKVEEEVPALLKALRYPFVLSKSSMYSVGAPHTWPLALGALTWMIDHVKIVSHEQETLFRDFCDDDEDIEEGLEYNKLVEDYSAEEYSKFMKGEDMVDDMGDVFLNKLTELYNVDEALLDSMEEKYKILGTELHLLENDSQADRLTTKRLLRVKLQTDLKNLLSYQSRLDSFKASLECKYSELSDEQETTESHLESLKHEQNELQQLLKNQKFTPADVERITREKRELQQTISSLSKSLEDAEQHKWNEEIALAKFNEKAELKVAEYHKLARKLKLIPLSAENACGHDFEIRLFESCTMDQHKVKIQMLLRKLVGNVEEENSRLANMKHSLEEFYEQVGCNILDKSNDLKNLKEQIRKVDERLDSVMQESAQEEQDWATEMETVENHRDILKKKVTYGYDEAVLQLKAAQQQYHLVLQETNEERRTVANNLASVFTTAANHLSVTEKCMEDLHIRVQRICSKAVEEDDAAIQKLGDISKRFTAR
ncbi:kinetochore protein NDC80 homolog [Pseudochaenichthys georgianus]|uniref:kinetochore protein NDC80 homolog n=1 Tax=Pseudochaenichthys georgianus TaxID=52239 RepID=UPI001469DAB9|nr:kinetochore protein NDC80 homolog [Pseudochaenichthys georgianus]